MDDLVKPKRTWTDSLFQSHKARDTIFRMQSLPIVKYLDVLPDILFYLISGIFLGNPSTA